MTNSADLRRLPDLPISALEILNGGGASKVEEVLSNSDVSGLVSLARRDVSQRVLDCCTPTLCGEEECPLFLGKTARLHCGLPDPAAVEGPEAERLEAFRRVRDDLRRRIEEFFARPEPSDP
jgi:hypothetical protein